MCIIPSIHIKFQKLHYGISKYRTISKNAYKIAFLKGTYVDLFESRMHVQKSCYIWRIRLGPLSTFSRTTWPTLENAENRSRDRWESRKGPVIRMRPRGYPWLPVNQRAPPSASPIAQQDEPLCSAWQPRMFSCSGGCEPRELRDPWEEFSADSQPQSNPLEGSSRHSRFSIESASGAENSSQCLKRPQSNSPILCSVFKHYDNHESYFKIFYSKGTF